MGRLWINKDFHTASCTIMLWPQNTFY